MHRYLHSDQKVVFRWPPRSSKYIKSGRKTLYFDAVEVEVKTFLLLFRLALAIPWLMIHTFKYLFRSQLTKSELHNRTIFMSNWTQPIMIVGFLYKTYSTCTAECMYYSKWILSRWHPIFSGKSPPKGHISLTIDKANWLACN